MEHCIAKGYRFAGVQYRYECFCGNTAPPQEVLTGEEECDMVCSGDNNQICGGGWRMNVYSVQATTTTTSTTSTTSTAVLIVGGWDTGFTAELYFPTTDQGCNVANYATPPIGGRGIHSTIMETFGNDTILCGGG